MPASILPAPAQNLSDALTQMVGSAFLLLSDAKPAARLLKDGIGPDESEFPGARLCRLDLQSPYWLDPEFREQSKRRQIGWPKILDELSETLPEFWTAWHRAQDALDAMPRSIWDELHKTPDAASKIQVRRSLDKIAEPIKWSDRLPIKSGTDKPSVHRFLESLDKNGPPNWTDQFEQLQRYATDLNTLRGYVEEHLGDVGKEDVARAKGDQTTTDVETSKNKQERKRKLGRPRTDEAEATTRKMVLEAWQKAKGVKSRKDFIIGWNERRGFNLTVSDLEAYQNWERTSKRRKGERRTKSR